MRIATFMLSILLSAATLSGCERGEKTNGTPTKASLGQHSAAGASAAKDAQSMNARKHPLPTGLAEELRTIAKGTWVGDFGKLDFTKPSTVSYNLKRCDYAEGDPPELKLTNCESMSGQGAVTFSDYSMKIAAPADSIAATISLSAFISKDGKLHVGSGQVARLAADRTGSLPFFARHALELGKSDCQVRNIDTNKVYATTCTWTVKTGYELLQFHAAFEGTQMDRTFAYLPTTRLLVAPQLILMSFSKK